MLRNNSQEGMVLMGRIWTMPRISGVFTLVIMALLICLFSFSPAGAQETVTPVVSETVVVETPVVEQVVVEETVISAPDSPVVSDEPLAPVEDSEETIATPPEVLADTQPAITAEVNQLEMDEATKEESIFSFKGDPEMLEQHKGVDKLGVRLIVTEDAKAEIRVFSWTPEVLSKLNEFDNELASLAAKTAMLEVKKAGKTRLEEVAAEIKKVSKDRAAFKTAELNALVLAKPIVHVKELKAVAGKPLDVPLKKLKTDTPYVINITATNSGNASLNHQLESRTITTFKPNSALVFIMAVILIILIMVSIKQAEAGRDFYIRRIAGLNAIDEAVGRATEMGKPVLYLTGLHDLSSIATLASISILSKVAEKTAEYETPILVPNCRSIVMVTTREVVKESYMRAGKADHYQEDNITYLTDDQFGFTSGVDGIMMREKPAANFYLGHFMAESLIYAETGHSVGAIQIAGTEEFSQIPFFITACDYTLIGEELFAAGAYLSRQPRDVGSLRGQDIGKLFFIALILVGVLLQTAGYMTENTSLFAFSDMFHTN
jgi:hypothetical protein